MVGSTSKTHSVHQSLSHPYDMQNLRSKDCNHLPEFDEDVIGEGVATSQEEPSQEMGVSNTEMDIHHAHKLRKRDDNARDESSLVQQKKFDAYANYTDFKREAEVEEKHGVLAKIEPSTHINCTPSSSPINLGRNADLKLNSSEFSEAAMKGEIIARESKQEHEDTKLTVSPSGYETAKKDYTQFKEEEQMIDADDIIIVSEKRVTPQNNATGNSLGNERDAFKMSSKTDLSKDKELNEIRGKVMQQRILVKDLHYMLSEATTSLNGLERQMADRVTVLRRAADAAFDWNGNRFPWDAVLAKELKEVFHINSFRPLQRESLNATLLRRDVYAILPTGAGKSLLYQLAAVVDRGLTLVVTPLISLSVDQRRALRELNIYGECLDSMSTKSVVKHIFNNVLPRDGLVRDSSQPRQKRRKIEKKRRKPSRPDWTRDDMETTILFVTPEQLIRNKKLMSRVEMMYEAGHLTRVVIDEAHCCSSWGHDFRADYRKLGIVKRQCPETPVLALSATSCPETTADVCKILEISDCVIFRGSIDRPNLFYEVRPKPDDEEKVIADIASMLLNEFRDQCGIVYVLSRKEAETYSQGFSKLGIRCGCYHGEMTREERASVHGGWQDGRVQVVVATLAFGLGIDNQRTRFVVHATMATSIEGYYQESGRAGRNGSPAKCVMLHRAKDFARLSAFVAEKGDARLRKMYEMYRYATGRGSEEDGDVRARCRRAVIAAAFGEKPPKREEEERRLCCDICVEQNGNGKIGVVMMDVTEMARSVLRIMMQQDERVKVTILMLATNWSNKGEKGRQMRGDEPVIDRRVSVEARIEIIIGLVFMDALQEYHRHSSYSVNAYITLGPNAERVLDGSARVTAMLRDEDARIVEEVRS